MTWEDPQGSEQRELHPKMQPAPHELCQSTLKPEQIGISVPQRAAFEEQSLLPPFMTSVQAAMPDFLLSRDPAGTRGAD